MVIITTTLSGKPVQHAVFDKLEFPPDVVQKIVVQHLGSEYELEGVMDLKTLGYEDWPRNIAAKISVQELEKAVAAYVKE